MCINEQNAAFRQNCLIMTTLPSASCLKPQMEPLARPFQELNGDIFHISLCRTRNYVQIH